MALTNSREDSLPVFLRKNLYSITFVVWFFLRRLMGTDFSVGSIWLGYYEMEVDLAAAFALTVYMVLNCRFTPRQLAAVGVITLVLLVSLKITGYSILFASWMFMAAAKDQDLDTLIRVIFWTLFGTFLMTVGLFLIGRIHEQVQERGGRWLRHSLGYGHPNALGLAFLQMTACWFILRRNRLRPGDLMLGLAAAVFIFAVPNSQTAFAGTVLLTVLGAYLVFGAKLPEKLCRAVPWILTAAVAGANLMSLALTFGFPLGGIMNKISGLLSTRPGCAYKIFAVYGISLLGQELPPMSEEVILNGQPWVMPWLDSGYFTLLLRYGLLSYLVISGLYLLTGRAFRKSGNVLLLGITAILAVYGIMEMALYDVSFNPLAVLLSAGLYGSVRLSEETQQ